jgi:ketosteroid isomerase-like protein
MSEILGRPMPQNDVERLRAFFEQDVRVEQDVAALDLSLMDPDVVFEDSVLPDHVGEYRGHEGMVRAARTWLDAYEQFTIELERIVGTGDRVVSVHRFRGTGRSSGIEQSFRFAYLWTFRNAKVVHFVSFRNPEEALEALGPGSSRLS